MNDTVDNNTNNILTFNALHCKCNGNINILTYNKLYTAIPSNWKEVIIKNDQKDISKLHKMFFKDANISKLYNKNVYQFLISLIERRLIVKINGLNVTSF